MKSFDFIILSDGTVQVEHSVSMTDVPADIESLIYQLTDTTDVLDRIDDEPCGGTVFLYNNPGAKLMVRLDAVEGNIGVVELSNYTVPE